MDGTRARTTARSFAIETDEPAPLGGTDQAVDPMELLLASLGTCLTIGWATQAAKRGIDFRALRIDYTVHVDSDVTPDVLEEIRKAAERTSPTSDNVANGASVTATLRHTNAPNRVEV